MVNRVLSFSQLLLISIQEFNIFVCKYEGSSSTFLTLDGVDDDDDGGSGGGDDDDDYYYQ